MIRPRYKCVSTLCVSVSALFLCGVARAAAPAFPAPFETFGGTAWTVADFDGDGQPDIVTARPEVTGSRFRHHIEIQLSAGTGRVVSFAFDGVPSGIQVAARDVDGDHEIDLVFVTAVSHQPVSVWINDGSGEFAPARNDRNCGAPFAALTAADSLSSSEHAGRFSFIPRQFSSHSGPGVCAWPFQPPSASASLFDNGPERRNPQSYGSLRSRAPPAQL